MELDERPVTGMWWNWQKLLAIGVSLLLWVLIIAVLNATVFAVGAPTRAPTQPAVQLQVDPKVQVSLQALDRLRQMGYSWTSDAGALKAIKHWQKVNGLVVDGIVGPQTSASLGIRPGAKPVAGVRPPASTPAAPSPPEPAVPAPDPPPSRPAEGDVEAIIRDVWPDDLEEWAIRIVSRETGRTFDPTVRNSCCWGLFQIHWRAHRGWLADYGVTSPEQLLDARTNATVALALYQATGPGPWAL